MKTIAFSKTGSGQAWGNSGTWDGVSCREVNHGIAEWTKELATKMRKQLQPTQPMSQQTKEAAVRFVCEGQTRFVFPAEVDKLVAYIDGDVDGEERLETTFDESMTNEFNAAAAIIDAMQSRFRNHGAIETQLADMVKNLGKVKSEAEKAQKATETKGLATQKHLQQMVLHASARAEQVQASAALVAQLDDETEERRLRTIERAEMSIGCLTIHTPAAASGASAAAASGASTANPVSIGECGRWVNKINDNVGTKDFNKEAGIAGLVVNNLDKAYAAEGRTEWSLLGDGPSQVCAEKA